MTTDLGGELTTEQAQAILEPVVDYIESWLDGDPERMAGCLHPSLVKRQLLQANPGADVVVDTMSRDDMVADTAQGYGRKLARPYETRLLDAYGDIATVLLLSSAYLDYVHVARFGDRWLIVNVLWARRSTA